MTEIEPSRPHEVWCCLDRDDRIASVGGRWNASAVENGAEFLAGEGVVGTATIGSQASGLVVRHAYRCDAPCTKTLVEMRVIAIDGAMLRISHIVLGDRALPFEIQFREAPKRAKASLLRCSNCNRVKFKDGGAASWREPETCARPDVANFVIHTVCPDCRAGISVRERWVAGMASPSS
jgi:hypothetical protein